MMTSLVAAEDETEAAYRRHQGAAAALDARDLRRPPERVGASAAGRHMRSRTRRSKYRGYAPLHDIGKIGIRDRVLSKRGPLTDEEFEIIKTHPTVGATSCGTCRS
jgi:response regulator RpfG family c-di-GMP phosphodiesterase